MTPPSTGKLGNGPGRPPHPDVLTPAEWRVLEHVRAGRSNAEIAEQLRLSPNTVRYHVSNMLSKLHVEGRDALAQWGGQPRRVPVLAWLLKLGWVTGAAALVAALALLLLAALSSARAPAGGNADAGNAAVPPEPSAGTLEPSGTYRAFTPEKLDRAGFIDTGRVFIVDGNPDVAAEVSYRGGFSVVRFASTTFVAVDSRLQWRNGDPPEQLIYIRDSWRQSITIDGRQLFLIGVAGNDTSRAGAAPNFGFWRLTRNGSLGSPDLIVQLIDAQGREHPVIVDCLGHVWLRSQPLAPGVVAYDTGEHLDVSGAEALGPLSEGIGNWTNDTICEGGVCFAILHEAAGLRAVADGVLTCVVTDEGLRLVLETPRYHLTYESSRGIRPPAAECEEPGPRVVTTGDLLTTHPSWHVSATTPDGAPLSVGIDRDRIMYVGDFDVAVSVCAPCRPRWQ